MPDPVGIWPPAPGWWLLAGLIIACIASLAVYVYRRRQRNRYRTEALSYLQQLQQKTNAADTVFACHALLKRTFFSAYPGLRNQVAAQQGDQWLAALTATCDLDKLPDNRRRLFNRFFSGEQYQATSELQATDNVRAFMSVCEHWIRHHRPSPPVLSAAEKGGE